MDRIQQHQMELDALELERIAKDIKATESDWDFWDAKREAEKHLRAFWTAYYTLMAIFAISTVSGCALAPNTVRTEVQHMSHVTQHFGDHRTNIGSESLNVIAEWRRGGAYVDISEGYNLSSGMGVVQGIPCPGGICGSREIFTASVGYIWRVKP